MKNPSVLEVIPTVERSTEKVVLFALAAVGAETTAEGIAEKVGIKPALADTTLRALAKSHPGLVARRPWLDENERKRVAYRYVGPGHVASGMVDDDD